jgi:hypothetical protein
MIDVVACHTLLRHFWFLCQFILQLSLALPQLRRGQTSVVARQRTGKSLTSIADQIAL